MTDYVNFSYPRYAQEHCKSTADGQDATEQNVTDSEAFGAAGDRLSIKFKQCMDWIAELDTACQRLADAQSSVAHGPQEQASEPTPVNPARRPSGAGLRKLSLSVVPNESQQRPTIHRRGSEAALADSASESSAAGLKKLLLNTVSDESEPRQKVQRRASEATLSDSARRTSVVGLKKLPLNIVPNTPERPQQQQASTQDTPLPLNFSRTHTAASLRRQSVASPPKLPVTRTRRQSIASPRKQSPTGASPVRTDSPQQDQSVESDSADVKSTKGDASRLGRDERGSDATLANNLRRPSVWQPSTTDITRLSDLFVELGAEATPHSPSRRDSLSPKRDASPSKSLRRPSVSPHDAKPSTSPRRSSVSPPHEAAASKPSRRLSISPPRDAANEADNDQLETLQLSSPLSPVSSISTPFSAHGRALDAIPELSTPSSVEHDSDRRNSYFTSSSCPTPLNEQGSLDRQVEFGDDSSPDSMQSSYFPRQSVTKDKLAAIDEEQAHFTLKRYFLGSPGKNGGATEGVQPLRSCLKKVHVDVDVATPASSPTSSRRGSKFMEVI